MFLGIQVWLWLVICIILLCIVYGSIIYITKRKITYLAWEDDDIEGNDYEDDDYEDDYEDGIYYAVSSKQEITKIIGDIFEMLNSDEAIYDIFKKSVLAVPVENVAPILINNDNMSKKDRANQKREVTMLKKYGVKYAFQLKNGSHGASE